MKYLALGLSLLLAACPDKPPKLGDPEYVENEHDGIGTPFGDACSNLRGLRCGEGFPRNGRTCYDSLVQIERFARFPTECVIRSKTPEEIRKCGDPNSVPVRCTPY